MENTNLPVPLMREQVTVGTGTGHATTSLGPALASVGVFFLFTIIGFIAAIFAGKIAFLAMVLLGIGASVLTHVVGKRIGKLMPGPKLEEKVLLTYQPVFARLNTVGFDAAVDSSRAIVKIALNMTRDQPQIFRIIDESLRFYLVRLLKIADVKVLLGDSRDLKRQFERAEAALAARAKQTSEGKPISASETEAVKQQLSDIQKRLDRLEQINRAALQLTSEIHSLRSECENTMVEKLVGDEETRKSQALLKEQLDREKRIEAELKLLGV